MIQQKLATKLQQPKPAFGISLRFHDPAIIETIGGAWDFVWIDAQHGTIGLEHLANLIRACDLAGTTSFVRLPKNTDMWVGNILDMDPGGVIMAQVNSVAEAQRLVRAAKFTPLGERSFGGRRIIDHHGRDYMAKANRDQLLFVQIESRAALEQCEALAAVPGVDGLMIGPDDLRLESGQPLSSSLFEGEALDAVKRMSSACRAAGKLAFGFGSDNAADVNTVTAAGLNLVSISADVLYLVRGSAASRKMIDALG